MDNLRKMGRVAAGALRENFSGVRPYFVALVTLALVHLGSSDVRELCTQYAVKASFLPLFSYLFSETYYILFLNFLFLVLICDVPLRGDHQTYVVLRCGRGIWAGGQVLYVALIATLYLLWIFLSTLIVLCGSLSFSADWGRVYFSLARIQTDGGVAFGAYLQTAFTATHAFLLCFGLQWLCLMLFGMMVYAINLATGKNVGMVLPCFFLLLYFRIAQFIMGTEWSTWISPVLLSRVKCHCVPRPQSLAYSLCYFGVSIAALIVCCLRLARRRRGGISANF